MRAHQRQGLIGMTIVGLGALALIVVSVTVNGCKNGKSGPGADEVVVKDAKDITSPGARYVEIMDKGKVVAFMDGTCRVHLGPGIDRKKLKCLRPSGECESEAQWEVNARLWAQRTIEKHTKKKVGVLCKELDAKLRGGK